MLKIFISYARRDERDVNPLRTILRDRGHDVWVDRRSIRGGSEWAKEIENAIKNTDVLLLCCSQAALDSDWVHREIDIAKANNTTIIPLLLQPDCIHPAVNHVQWIDFTVPAYYDEALSRLLDSLSALAQNRIRHMQETKSGRVILSYQYNLEPDRTLAQQIEQRLIWGGSHVFVDDQYIQMGTRGADRVQEALDSSGFLVLLLSEGSVDSEIVRWETERAYELAQAQKLKILPVRVGLRKEYPYPLRQFLNSIPWAFWQGIEDTPRLLDEIETALRGGDLGLVSSSEKLAILRSEAPNAVPMPQPFADPTALEQPTGTVSMHSQFYIERPGDKLMHDQLAPGEKGATIIIKAPRQMGKSSLLMRGREFASGAGSRAAYMDFQLLDTQTLSNEEVLYKRFCRWIVSRLKLKDSVPDIDEYWDDIMGSVWLCTQYIEEEILPVLDGQRITLAIDEVDRLFSTPYSSDFFGMLRSWHNNRAWDETWRSVDIVLVISTEPHMLIDNLNQSPFNVGVTIALDDFSPEQVVELNRRHNFPLTQGQLDELIDLIGGHPYLTREALYQVATGRLTGDGLLKAAAEDTGPFGNHLMHFLFMLNEFPELETAMLQIIRGENVPSKILVTRLQSAGLVRDTDNGVRLRNRLYAEYFGKRLMR